MELVSKTPNSPEKNSSGVRKLERLEEQVKKENQGASLEKVKEMVRILYQEELNKELDQAIEEWRAEKKREFESEKNTKNSNQNLSAKETPNQPTNLENGNSYSKSNNSNDVLVERNQNELTESMKLGGSMWEFTPDTSAPNQPTSLENGNSYSKSNNSNDVLVEQNQNELTESMKLGGSMWEITPDTSAPNQPIAKTTSVSESLVNDSDLAEFVSISKPEKDKPQVAGEKVSVNKNEDGHVILDLEGIIDEEKKINALVNGFEDTSKSSSLMDYLTLNNLLSGFAAKRNLGITVSTAFFAFSNPVLTAGLGTALGVSALVEHSINGDFKYTTTALGVAASLSGVGLGVPLLMGLAGATTTGVGYFLFKEAIFNPNHVSNLIFGGIGTALNSPVTHILSSIAAYMAIDKYGEAISNYFHDWVEEVKNNGVVTAKEELAQCATRANSYNFMGLPVGCILRPINNLWARVGMSAAESAGNCAANIAHTGVDNAANNLGVYTRSSIIESFERNGNTFISAIMFIPTQIRNNFDRLIELGSNVLRNDQSKTPDKMANVGF